MKKIFIVISILTILASCGKRNIDNSTAGHKSDPVLDDLTQEESQILDDLKKTEVIGQKELMQKLMSFNSLNQKTLKIIDSNLNVKCMQSNGLCYITQKD